MVILMNRPDAYDRDSPRWRRGGPDPGQARNGPIKTALSRSRLHLSCFSDLRKRGFEHDADLNVFL